MGSSVGLSTRLSGKRASQTGLDVTSHDSANADTPGSTRQRVELHAAPSYGSPIGPLGTGVDVSQGARLRDVVLDDRFRNAIGDLGLAAVRADTLASMESLGGEPDNGNSIRLDRLWDAAGTEANDLHDLDPRMANAAPSWIGPEPHDQRDRRLDQVASLAGASARIGADGRATVRLGGAELLTSDGPATTAAATPASPSPGHRAPSPRCPPP